jgi:mxaK protein
MSVRRLFLVLTVLVLAGSVAGVIFLAGRLLLDHRDNGLIVALTAGRDLATSADDPPSVVFGRLYFLATRDRLDEAQPLLNHLLAQADRRVAAAALYDMANARLRKALDHLESGGIDPAIPLVRLAKDGYRRALTLDPGFWDAKYNLDVAMRLVRDFPQIDAEGEEIPPEAAKKLWTDLPGLPKGLP